MSCRGGGKNIGWNFMNNSFYNIKLTVGQSVNEYGTKEKYILIFLPWLRLGFYDDFFCHTIAVYTMDLKIVYFYGHINNFNPI